MKDYEKKICDDILRYGQILCDEEMKSATGILIRQYVVKYNNTEYVLTKNNGEWVYLNCSRGTSYLTK